jgi:hypothetical protein
MPEPQLRDDPYEEESALRRRAIIGGVTNKEPADDWDPDEETQAILADSRAMAAIREAEDPNAEYVTLEVVEAIFEARKAREGL